MVLFLYLYAKSAGGNQELVWVTRGCLTASWVSGSLALLVAYFQMFRKFRQYGIKLLLYGSGGLLFVVVNAVHLPKMYQRLDELELHLSDEDFRNSLEKYDGWFGAYRFLNRGFFIRSLDPASPMAKTVHGAVPARHSIWHIFGIKRAGLDIDKNATLFECRDGSIVKSIDADSFVDENTPDECRECMMHHVIGPPSLNPKQVKAVVVSLSGRPVRFTGEYVPGEEIGGRIRSMPSSNRLNELAAKSDAEFNTWLGFTKNNEVVIAIHSIPLDSPLGNRLKSELPGDYQYWVCSVYTQQKEVTVDTSRFRIRLGNGTSVESVPFTNIPGTVSPSVYDGFNPGSIPPENRFRLYFATPRVRFLRAVDEIVLHVNQKPLTAHGEVRTVAQKAHMRKALKAGKRGRAAREGMPEDPNSTMAQFAKIINESFQDLPEFNAGEITPASYFSWVSRFCSKLTLCVKRIRLLGERANRFDYAVLSSFADLYDELARLLRGVLDFAGKEDIHANYLNDRKALGKYIFELEKLNSLANLLGIPANRFRQLLVKHGVSSEQVDKLMKHYSSQLSEDYAFSSTCRMHIIKLQLKQANLLNSEWGNWRIVNNRPMFNDAKAQDVFNRINLELRKQMRAALEGFRQMQKRVKSPQPSSRPGV